MSKKKRKSQSVNDLPYCENDGGLGIPPCEDVGQLAIVDMTVSMEFTGLDHSTVHLCHACAQRLKEHATAMGYDVEID